MPAHPRPGSGNFELAELVGQVGDSVCIRKQYNRRKTFFSILCLKYATFDLFLIVTILFPCA